MTIDWTSVIAVPIVGAVVGFAVWYFQSRIETLRSEQGRLHDERRALYAAILDPYIRIMAAIKSGENTDAVVQDILSYDYRKAGFEFTLIAPDDVVRAYNDLMQFFYNAEAQGGVAPQDMLRTWGGFLLTLRRNLGNPATKLKEVDMLRGWITDIDQMLGPGSG